MDPGFRRGRLSGSPISCTVFTADYRDFRGAVNYFKPLAFRG
jgi:hypothetical protein